MAENSKIEWTDHTFNAWRGCTKVAAGCANCYADAQAKRNPGTLGIWGDSGTRVVASEAMWKQPEKWNREAILRCSNCGQSTKGERLVKGANPLDVGYDFQCIGCESEKYTAHRPRVFCASMADVFEDWKGQVRTHDGGWLVINPDGRWFVNGNGERCPSGSRFATLDDVRARLFSQIDETPNLDRLLLTKRPENIPKMWPEIACEYCSDSSCSVHRAGVIDRLHRKNVWLGTSIACQADADKNIPELLKCRHLSPVLFLSIEPLVGPVDLEKILTKPAAFGLRMLSRFYRNADGSESQFNPKGDGLQITREVINPLPINWVIVGGESGPNARPMHPDWVRSIRDQCQAAGVPFFFKQWGEWARRDVWGKSADGYQFRHCHAYDNAGREDDDLVYLKVGKAASGRRLDGREWNEMPEVQR